MKIFNLGHIRPERLRSLLGNFSYKNLLIEFCNILLALFRFFCSLLYLTLYMVHVYKNTVQISKLPNKRQFACGQHLMKCLH